MHQYMRWILHNVHLTLKFVYKCIWQGYVAVSLTFNRIQLSFRSQFASWPNKMCEQRKSEDSPLEKFLLSSKLIRILTYPVGLNVLQEDFRITPKTWILFVHISILYVSSVYTGIKYKDDICKVLEMLCINGLAIPVSQITQHSRLIGSSFITIKKI